MPKILRTNGKEKHLEISQEKGHRHLRKDPSLDDRECLVWNRETRRRRRDTARSRKESGTVLVPASDPLGMEEKQQRSQLKKI